MPVLTRLRAAGGQREPHELAHVQRALDRDRIADPADGGVLVAGGEGARRDVGDERKVHVQALAAGRVLLVADQAGRRSVDAKPGWRAGRIDRWKDAVEGRAPPARPRAGG